MLTGRFEAGGSSLTILAGLLSLVLPTPASFTGECSSEQFHLLDREEDELNRLSKLFNDPKMRSLKETLSYLDSLQKRQAILVDQWKMLVQQKNAALNSLKQRYPNKILLYQKTKEDETYQKILKKMNGIKFEYENVQKTVDEVEHYIHSTRNKLLAEIIKLKNYFFNPLQATAELAKILLKKLNELLIIVTHDNDQNKINSIEIIRCEVMDYLALTEMSAEDELTEALPTPTKSSPATAATKLQTLIAKANIGFSEPPLGSNKTADIFIGIAINNMRPLDPEQDRFLKQALPKAANEQGLTLLLEDHTFKICVLPSEQMQIFSRHQDGIANGCTTTLANVIFLGSHLFRDLTDDEQLVSTLADEFCHGMTRQKNAQRLIPNYRLQTNFASSLKFMDYDFVKIQRQLLHPWKNVEEFNEIKAAFLKFTNRVEEFMHLRQISSERRTPEQQETLNNYNNVMQFHRLRRYDLKGFNSLQFFYRDIGKKKPRTEKERIAYNAHAFVKEYQLFYLEYCTPAGAYSGLSPELTLTEKCSYFASYRPEIQKGFGPELCESLSKFHEVTDYCSRAAPDIKDDGYGIWPPGERPSP